MLNALSSVSTINLRFNLRKRACVERTTQRFSRFIAVVRDCLC
jgi:hypothetical protein